ncbi:MAG: hypothetical protein GY909_15520 [Oligoflexia bacterium]|nr:hypothetical protein [Oligoflexia bacterium]
MSVKTTKELLTVKMNFLNVALQKVQLKRGGVFYEIKEGSEGVKYLAFKEHHLGQMIGDEVVLGISSEEVSKNEQIVKDCLSNMGLNILSESQWIEASNGPGNV